MPPKKGYKQTPEHASKRIRSGDAHCRWKGDSITPKSGRSRAARLYPDIGPCTICGSPRSERHHRDGNTVNNEASNIDIICRKCHMKKDGRLSDFTKLSKDRIDHLQILAANAKKSKTHCKRGHEYNDINTKLNKKGARLCIICLKMASRKSYNKLKGLI